MTSYRRRVVVALLSALIVPLIVAAQGRRASQFRQAAEYDGKLTFTRLFYGSVGPRGRTIIRLLTGT
jgi:hypothetical protein